jgi:hypothetical protein
VGSDGKDHAVEYLDEDDERSDGTARDWVTPEVTRLTMSPREIARVPVRVAVPADAGGGGRYAAVAVRAIGKLGNDTSQLGVQSQIAVPILVAVSGDVRVGLDVSDIAADAVSWNREPWTLRTSVTNTGSTHVIPTGTVEIENMFGTVVERIPVSTRILLPEGSAPIETTWKQTPWFGRYTATVRMTPSGEQSPVAEESTVVWTLPPWWWFAAAAGVIAVIFVARRLRRRDGGFDEFDYEDE